MNDFTKEELESLMGAFNWIDEDPAYRTVGGWNKELQEKIQSMIDNYCEHSPDFGYALHYTTPKCNKCGEFY